MAVSGCVSLKTSLDLPELCKGSSVEFEELYAMVVSKKNGCIKNKSARLQDEKGSSAKDINTHEKNEDSNTGKTKKKKSKKRRSGAVVCGETPHWRELLCLFKAEKLASSFFFLVGMAVSERCSVCMPTPCVWVQACFRPSPLAADGLKPHLPCPGFRSSSF
ncbi:hypothetical protein RRG08_066253 [Elysia crispata]|uniref:Uncharacterized protein n=1 Tax=Elysia crispata TaxID=231223 RepID=A0AAE1EEN9_9GAST|nr:hypothetical protein RRG08_066253 [Elysia crispata]